MKKVINGRSYNTETAKELGYQTNGYANNDIYFTGETLYRKKTGEFFLYGEGGAYSIYGRDFGMSRGGGEKIIPLSEDEAKNWAEKYLDTFIINKRRIIICSHIWGSRINRIFICSTYNRITI